MNNNGIIRAREITRLALPNGLVILVHENHATPSVSVRGMIKAGGMYDSDAKAGLADFAAQSLERGTASLSYQEINKLLDSMGATLSVEAGDDAAGVFGRSLTEDLDALLDVVGDLLLRPTFPTAEVNKVRGEILTGLIEDENDTQWVSDFELHKALFPVGHPYHRPIEGTKETVASITRADLARFHASYYRPDSTAIALVGDITPDQAAKKIERVLGAWQAKGPQHPFTITDVRGTTSAHHLRVPVAGKTQADIALGFPGLARTSSDFHAANVANMILGVLGLSGRLGDTVRDQQGLAYYVSSSLRAGIGAGPWLVRAGVNPANVDKAIAGITAELERMRQAPVSAEELSAAQDYLTGSLALRLETNSGVADLLLNCELYNLGLDYLERYNGIIRGLTTRALLEAAQKYIDLERAVVVVAGPV